MTSDSTLAKYKTYLTKLNRATVKGMGKAPHKPILLLSILQLIRKRDITSNRIFSTPELVLAFKSNWATLVTTPHISNFALPFFHLNSEPFWHLHFNYPHKTVKSINTLKALKDTIAFAEIDTTLFLLLNDPVTSAALEQLLLETYFPETSSRYGGTPVHYALELEIKNQLVNDTKEEYQHKMEILQQELTEEEIEEERYIRGGLFKKEIPRIYNYQCCISGMKIETTVNAQMVDACHIIPFSLSNDDTLPNGICLSPNLHRAFDRGLLTINEDYIVRISPSVKEALSPYSITQFEGQHLSLPKEPRLYPSLQNLSWHRKERFVF
jgi:putative restriction endonuclease